MTGGKFKGKKMLKTAEADWMDTLESAFIICAASKDTFNSLAQ